MTQLNDEVFNRPTTRVFGPIGKQFMRLFRILASVALLTIVVVLSAAGQTAKNQNSSDNSATASANESPETAKAAAAAEDETQSWLHLVDGRRILVAEATQDSDGFWFKVGNVTTFVDNTVVGNVQYSYRTRSFNTGGMSGYSNVVSVKTPRK